MERLLVKEADHSVGRHLVNALAGDDPRLRAGDIRHPVHERSPAHLMSPAAPGRTSDDTPVRHMFGSKPRSSRAEGAASAYARIAAQAHAGGGRELARSAAKQRFHQSVTVR